MTSTIGFLGQGRAGSRGRPLENWPRRCDPYDTDARLPLGTAETTVVLLNGEQLIVEGDVTDVWQRLAKEKAGEELFFSECFRLAGSARQVVIARDKVLYLEAHGA